MKELEMRLAILGERAAELIQPNSRVGLGSGSTAEAFIRALGNRVSRGLHIQAVATSSPTERLAVSVGICLIDIDDVDFLDLGIDGADEIDPNVNLTKGRGGALLREKLVANQCREFVVIAASEKLVTSLGTRMPLPIEIVPFAWRHIAAQIQLLGYSVALRRVGDAPNAPPIRTDGGNYILDCTTGAMEEPRRTADQIKRITGVVEHGLFIGMATSAMVVDESGTVDVIPRPPE